MNDRKKQIAINLGSETSTAFAEAIRHYADAIYPLSSTCAQVAREALYDIAQTFEQHEGDAMQVNRRHLPKIKAAVGWYFGPEGPAPSASVDDYLVILRPIKKTSEDLNPKVTSTTP